MTPTIEQRRVARNSLPPKLRKIAPDPDEDAVHALAGELARPVVLRLLSGPEAYAALALAASKLEDPEGGLARCWDMLRSHVRWRIDTRTHVARRILDAIAPLIDNRKPRNMLLAEAHGINGAVGFHFSEAEVNDLVETAVWHALPAAPFRGRRNAR